jgi:hypothetical protein
LVLQLLSQAGVLFPFIPAKGKTMRAAARLFCCLLLVSQTNQWNETLWAQGVVGSPSQLVLEDGTPLKLRISQTVSSADAHVNDRVEFEVLEEVRVSDVLIVPKGGLAWGTVTEAVPKRRMARGGKLEIVMDSVRLVDGQKAALRAVKDAKGGGHTGAMTAGIVATGLIFWPAAPFFLFMHGKDITIPKGTEVPTFVNGNFNLEPSKFHAASKTIEVAPSVAAQASVSVSSAPAGADIYLDGSFIGNTPSTLNVSSGKHGIVVKKSGFQEWTRQMNFSGGTITLNAELAAGNSVTPPHPASTVQPATSTPASAEFTVQAVQSRKTAPNPETDSPQGWIGISVKHFGSGGAVVAAIVPGGPAAQAGLKAGDVINQVNGIQLKEDEDFDRKIAVCKPGTKIRVGYMRGSWAFEALVQVGTEHSVL